MNNSAIARVKNELEQKIMESNTHWNISTETATYLTTLLKKEKPMRALEIGTSTGYSAICIGEALIEWNGTLVTIESHNKRYAIAKKNIADSGLSNISQVHGHAPEILQEISGTFDFIFFDATKYEHVSYFNALKDRLNKEGVIVADNMLSHEQEMLEYKITVEAHPQFESYIKDVGTGLMVSRKIL